MRPLTTSPSLILLLVLTLTLGFALPIAAERANPQNQEHTQYLRLPFWSQKPVDSTIAAHNGAPQGQDPLQGFTSKTYYRCRPRDGNEDEESRCGWHVPVVKAGASKALDTGVVVAAVVGAAGVFVLGLV